MDFLKKYDFSEKERKSYYKGLEVDVDAMINSFNEEGINVTMIAEKPSVAKFIAHVLSNNKCKTKHTQGFTRYEYYGEFKKKEAFFTVVSVYGHLYM